MQALSGSDWSLSNPLMQGSSFRHPFNPGMFPWPFWSAFTASDVGHSSMWRLFSLISLRCHSRMASLCVESFVSIMVNGLICLPFLWSNVNLLICSSVTPASFAIHWMIASLWCCWVRTSLVSEYFQKFLTRIFVALSARCFSTFVYRRYAIWFRCVRASSLRSLRVLMTSLISSVLCISVSSKVSSSFGILWSFSSLFPLLGGTGVDGGGDPCCLLCHCRGTSAIRKETELR